MEMTILKLALFGTLRIVVFGSLKVGIFVYALFLSDTAFAGAATEGTGYVANSDSYAAPEVGSIANMNKQDALLPAAHTRP